MTTPITVINPPGSGPIDITTGDVSTTPIVVPGAAPYTSVVVAGSADSGDVIVIDPSSPPLLVPSSPVGSPLVLVNEGSTTGPPGAPGKDGQPRFTGAGAPGVIIGAEPGDEYLDNLTGDLYRLS